MKDSSAVTLVEVLVTFGLLLLVLGMLVALLLPGFALFRKQGGQSDAYRTCLQTVERFRVEMLNTQIECLTLAPDHQAIGWQKTQLDPPFSGTSGEALMSDVFEVIHYRDNRVLLTQSEPTGIAATTIPSRLSFEQMDVLRATETRTLARDITAFSIRDQDPDSPLVSPPIRLSLTCTVSTKGRATNDVESFSMDASVTPRSQRW
jgi:hypothetical protein